jgi:hypothetical protein
LHHDNAPSHTSFFTREFVTKKNTTFVSHPPNVSLFPRLKIKLKGRHFDTIEMIEAESQAVLNTLTEYDLLDAFKSMADVLGTVDTLGNGLLRRSWRPIGPTIVFDHMAAPVPCARI